MVLSQEHLNVKRLTTRRKEKRQWIFRYLLDSGDRLLGKQGRFLRLLSALFPYLPTGLPIHLGLLLFCFLRIGKHSYEDFIQGYEYLPKDHRTVPSTFLWSVIKTKKENILNLIQSLIQLLSLDMGGKEEERGGGQALIIWKTFLNIVFCNF